MTTSAAQLAKDKAASEMHASARAFVDEALTEGAGRLTLTFSTPPVNFNLPHYLKCEQRDRKTRIFNITPGQLSCTKA